MHVRVDAQLWLTTLQRCRLRQVDSHAQVRPGYSLESSGTSAGMPAQRRGPATCIECRPCRNCTVHMC